LRRRRRAGLRRPPPAQGKTQTPAWTLRERPSCSGHRASRELTHRSPRAPPRDQGGRWRTREAGGRGLPRHPPEALLARTSELKGPAQQLLPPRGGRGSPRGRPGPPFGARECGKKTELRVHVDVAQQSRATNQVTDDGDFPSTASAAGVCGAPGEVRKRKACPQRFPRCAAHFPGLGETSGPYKQQGLF